MGLYLVACRAPAPPSNFSAPVEVGVDPSAAGPGFTVTFATAGVQPEAVLPAVVSAIAVASRTCPGVLPRGADPQQLEWRPGAAVSLPIGAAGECLAGVLRDATHAQAAQLSVRAMLRLKPGADAGEPAPPEAGAP